MIIGRLSGPGGLSGTLSGNSDISGGLSVPTVTPVEPYEGSYEFTPSGERQEIEIENKRATENIVINPIPDNYGLITWDGSVITVS